jgi:hypothetical protein
MFASPLNHQKTSPRKVAPTCLKYVTQRSLAFALFIAFAFVASFANKPSATRKLSVNNSLSGSQSREPEASLSLNPRRIIENTVKSLKDAFNDPALIEYANEQGIDGSDSLTTPCSHTSQKTETFHSSLNN